MLSKTPIYLDKVKPAELDFEILRLGMIAELDAVSFTSSLQPQP